MMIRRLTGLALCGLAMGCSGGGGGAGDGGGGPTAARYDVLMDRGEALTAEAETLGYTDPASLPTQGSASYEGVMAFDAGSFLDGEGGNYDLVGDLSLDVDFEAGADAISAEASRFVSSRGDAYDGTLASTSSVLDRAADMTTTYTYDFTLDGELTSPGAPSLAIVSDVAGDFFGASHDYASGLVTGGQICAESGGCSGLGGGFVAERWGAPCPHDLRRPLGAGVACAPDGAARPYPARP